MASKDSGSFKRVLVVDDHVDSAELIVEIALNDGHEARHAQDADAAVRVAAEFRPTDVLLDLDLAGVDGYEVARRIRGLAGTSLPRIIVVSGTIPEAQKCKAAGIEPGLHLLKPVDIHELRKILAASPTSEAPSPLPAPPLATK